MQTLPERAAYLMLELQTLADAGTFGKAQADAAELWCLHGDPQAWAMRGAHAALELADITNPPQAQLKQIAERLQWRMVKADELQRIRTEGYNAGWHDATQKAAEMADEQTWRRTAHDVAAEVIGLKARIAELQKQLNGTA